MTKLDRRIARRQQKTERTALWLERQRSRHRNEERWWTFETSHTAGTVVDLKVILGKPHSWYQFCVETKEAYERIGEHVAALVYWTMRFLDEPDVQPDPVTNEGYKELCAYWDYKASWFEEKHAVR